jgi:hypothetical protein
MTKEEIEIIAKDAYGRYRELHKDDLIEWDKYPGKNAWLVNVERMSRTRQAPMNPIETCVMAAINEYSTNEPSS